MNVCYKGSCLLAFSSPSCPFPPIPAQELHCYPGFVCASSQGGGGARWEEDWEGEMVTAGLIWAPGEKRLLTQEKLGRSNRTGDGEGKL